MDTNRNNEAFTNNAEHDFSESIAKPTGAVEQINCENCFEPMLFELRDESGRVYKLGLLSMLDCIRFAESEGFLPPFPDELRIWVQNVARHYEMRWDVCSNANSTEGTQKT